VVVVKVVKFDLKKKFMAQKLLELKVELTSSKSHDRLHHLKVALSKRGTEDFELFKDPATSSHKMEGLFFNVNNGYEGLEVLYGPFANVSIATLKASSEGIAMVS
jgi:hypothetical protein